MPAVKHRHSASTITTATITPPSYSSSPMPTHYVTKIHWNKHIFVHSQLALIFITTEICVIKRWNLCLHRNSLNRKLPDELYAFLSSFSGSVFFTTSIFGTSEKLSSPSLCTLTLLAHFLACTFPRASFNYPHTCTHMPETISQKAWNASNHWIAKAAPSINTCMCTIIWNVIQDSEKHRTFYNVFSPLQDAYVGRKEDFQQMFVLVSFFPVSQATTYFYSPKKNTFPFSINTKLHSLETESVSIFILFFFSLFK